MNIAVVIPYYQKSAGVLTRSLKSVFAQTLANDVRLDVIIADDASPLDPAGDIAEAGTPPAGVSIRVVKRANGGPGAARNTALDAVAKDCDLIAFIDSDDEWTPDHLSRAIEALGDEGDFYFANHKRNDGHPSDLDRSRFLKLADPEGRLAIAGVDVIQRPGAEIADFIVDDYLAHTSSIVIRASRLKAARYDERLRSAGEDHVFSLDLALGARQVCVSLKNEVVRGGGVSIYESAQAWGTPADFRRRVFNIAALKLMQARSAWSDATRKRMAKRLLGLRGAAAFLLIKSTVRNGKLDAGLLWRQDPVTVWLAPYFGLAFMTDKSLHSA